MPRDNGKKTWEKVLELLEINKDNYISGEDIAGSLGVSRNAIWKAIKELRSRGYTVEAVSNRGYRLSEGNDIISVQGIMAHIPEKKAFDPGLLCVYETLSSTSDVAKELAIKGTAHGTCVISSRQEGGRGRRDHTFYSPEGGIYMSVVFSPDKLPSQNKDEITTYIGGAICDAIEKLTGFVPHIKGINDLYLDRGKICGILIEAGTEFDSDTLQWIVAGIGINFDSDIAAFPEELRNTAAALYEPGTAPISKNELIAGIITRLIS